MTPRHHLDPATVTAYATGALPVELAVVVATHLGVCAHCRQQVRTAEHVGGMLLEQQQPVDASADASRHESRRAAILDRLDDAAPDQDIDASVPTDEAYPEADPDRLPLSLHPYFGASYRALKWRWMAPGVRCIRAPRRGAGALLLLKIAPGKSMPLHGHGGGELTQILQGAYDDMLGHFAPGDIADLDSQTLHQPVTSPGVPCVCVAALDGPLRFPGWLARTIQPLVGL